MGTRNRGIGLAKLGFNDGCQEIVKSRFAEVLKEEDRDVPARLLFS